MAGLTNFGGNSSKPNSEAGKFFCQVSDSKYCILGFAGHVVSVTSTQLCYESRKQPHAINTSMSNWGTRPLSLTSFTQTGGLRIWLGESSLWNPDLIHKSIPEIYFAKGHPLKFRDLPGLIASCPFSKSQQPKYFNILHSFPFSIRALFLKLVKTYLLVLEQVK